MVNRRNRFALFLSVLAMLLATTVFAHEGGKHFLGTVKAVDADSVTIVTTANETVTLKLLPTTKFTKSHQPASVQDLKAGERVVIHAKEDGKSWDAEEVQVGGAAPKK